MFELYREEHRIFGFEDYAVLMKECRRVSARKVLEFGPGISTLALIEGGAEKIATCEYQERFLAQAVERLKGYRQVTVHRYSNEPGAIGVDGLTRNRFDFAFVDSPLGLPSRGAVEHPGQEGCNRFNTVSFALRLAPVVLLHDAKRPGERKTIERIAARGDRVEMIDTRKGFARITRNEPYAIGAAVIRDKYRGRTAEIYDQRSMSRKWQAEEAAVERFLGALGDGATVLDIPVGTGRFLAAYKRHGLAAVGMDVSEDMLAQARLKMADAELRVGDILNIDMPARSVDAAVAVRILSWLTIEEMQWALDELARVARTWIVTGGGRQPERQAMYRSVPGFTVVDEALIDRNSRGDYELVLLRRAGRE